MILDVVYNHTCEGNHLGPTLSFRGIDNASYYRSPRPAALLRRLHRLRQHASTSQHPRVLQLVMDSLRYWVEEMHVDGFRFDLALGAGARGRQGRAPAAASSTRSARTRCSTASS